jgi:hypothetical protein
MTTAVLTWLVLLLCAAAGAKAWQLDRAATALATYGVLGPRAQRLAVRAIIAVELALASAVALAAPGALWAVAALFLAFALATLAALLAGRKGLPCACFGGSARLGWATPIRAATVALLAAVLALGWLPKAPAGYDRWLTVGLSASVAAIALLGVALLALAREVGVLRLAASGSGALEIPEEGPRVGALQEWAVAALPTHPRALLALAIFTSEGCPLCRRLAPAVQHVLADPLLVVGIFDEVADAGTWARAAVPGSPYAVALDLDGVALAKGTFNSLAQLESILGTARARERGLSVAA